MSKTSLLLIFLCSINILKLSGQVDFQAVTFIEAKEIANSENKLIFVDIYTSWCGPCKRMDKTTFQDPIIGNIMNTNFVPLKWDAESDKYKSLVKKYNVQSYPTFLFLNANGELVNKEIGYISAFQFEEVLNGIILVNKDPKLLRKLKKADKANVQETLEIFRITKGLNFPHKEAWVKNLLNAVESNPSLFKSEANLIFDQINHQYSLDMIEQGVSFLEPVVSLVDIRPNMRRLEKITDELNHRLPSGNDFELFNRIELVKRAVSSKMGNNKFGQADKEYRSNKLDFFAKHGIYKDFDLLADSLISEFILPYSPQRVYKSDQATEINTKKILENLPEEEKELLISEKPRTIIDSLKSVRFSGKNIADRLYSISQQYTNFDELEAAQEKALKWSNLAYEYLPLAKYQYESALLLDKLGRREEAIKRLELAKTNPYISESEMDSVLQTILDFKR